MNRNTENYYTIAFIILEKIVMWSKFENNYLTEMCSSFKTGSFLRLIDFVFHSLQGLGVVKKHTKSISSPNFC